MKTSFFISGWILILFAGCNQGNRNSSSYAEKNNKQPERELPEFEFNEDFHNFEKLSEGETVVFTFFFRNSGNNNLVLGIASSDCACINTKFNPEPV